MISGAVPLMGFYLGHGQEKNYLPCFPLTLAIATTISDTHGELGSYIGVYWLALALALVFLSSGLILIRDEIKHLFSRPRTDEYTDGFLELEGISAANC